MAYMAYYSLFSFNPFTKSHILRKSGRHAFLYHIAIRLHCLDSVSSLCGKAASWFAKHKSQ